MKTFIDIPEEQFNALDEICAREKCSHAAVVQQAIAIYIANHKRRQATDAFGLWRGRGIDGLEYQQKIRAEW